MHIESFSELSIAQFKNYIQPFMGGGEGVSKLFTLRHFIKYSIQSENSFTVLRLIGMSFFSVLCQDIKRRKKNK